MEQISGLNESIENSNAWSVDYNSIVAIIYKLIRRSVDQKRPWKVRIKAMNIITNFNSKIKLWKCSCQASSSWWNLSSRSLWQVQTWYTDGMDYKLLQTHLSSVCIKSFYVLKLTDSAFWRTNPLAGWIAWWKRSKDNRWVQKMESNYRCSSYFRYWHWNCECQLLSCMQLCWN